MEAVTLSGRFMRLEPLDHCHMDALVAAAVEDPSLYKWSAVPQNREAAAIYIETALELAKSRNGSGLRHCSHRGWSGGRFYALLRHRTLGLAARSRPAWTAASRCLRDRLHMALALGNPHRRQQRSQIADADTCFRIVADVARLPAHRCTQPAFTRRHRTDWRKV